MQSSGDLGFANVEAQCANSQDIFCSFFPLDVPSPEHWPDCVKSPEAECAETECPALLGLRPLLSYHSTSSHVGNEVLVKIQILTLVGRLKHSDLLLTSLLLRCRFPELLMYIWKVKHGKIC